MPVVSRQVIRILGAHGYKWPPKKPHVGLEVYELILISLGRKKLHDSGYPFIQVYGADKENNLYDLGMHDHIQFKTSGVNVDSLSANIFRMWVNRPLVVRDTTFISTLTVSEDYQID